MLHVESPILLNHDACIEIADGDVVDGQAERADGTADSVQLEAFPLEQVLVDIGVLAVEGAHAQRPAEAPLEPRGPLFQVERQFGVESAVGNEYGSSFRNIGVEIPQRDAVQLDVALQS